MGRQKSQNGKYSILLVWCLLVVFPHGVRACTDSNVFADYFDENATFQDLKSAVSKSVRISVGTVTGKRSFWSGDQTIILTEYRVEILEGIKGENPQIMMIVLEGGTIGDLQLDVSDVPHITVNKSYLFVWDEETAKRPEFQSPTNIVEIDPMSFATEIMLNDLHLANIQLEEE